MMSDPEAPEPPPALPPEGFSLRGLTTDGVDHTLKVDPDAAPEGTEADTPPAQSIPADEDRLGLPRDGLVAFRKSGGLRFSSRGFVAFRNGWVVPLAGTTGAPYRMTEAERTTLEALIPSGVSRTRHRKAKGSPDGYGYELTARHGGRTRYAEAEDGAIPEALGALIKVLQQLMPKS